ncbi:small acid-soluble spore protein SspJ [Bacillus sp. 4A_MP2]
MSFFQKDKKAKSEKDHQQVDQLLEEASKELAGDPLQEAVQRRKTTINKLTKRRRIISLPFFYVFPFDRYENV